jgi:ABC-type histidine transport system ATPase subunit
MKTSRSGERLPEDMRQVERIRSRLAMVFQSFNLWSHMTIMQNIIEVPIQVLKVPRAEAIARRSICSTGWGCGSVATIIPVTSPAVSSSGPPSPGRWRWSPR